MSQVSDHWSAGRLAAVAAAAFLLVGAAGYAALSRLSVPDYGTWTGIRPLETKLRALEAYAAGGAVDALILGSSISEFGFSATLFSELMTRKLGREYRAYNFSTGGAEPRTLPKLYRLARTAAKPKTVFVVHPAEPKLQNRIYEGSPDITLDRAPVGGVLRHTLLLEFNRFVWGTGLLRNAAGIRDLLLYGHYRNLQQAVGMESYALSRNGDRVSYVVTWKAGDLPLLRKVGASLTPYAGWHGPGTDARLENALDFHFARIDIDAMQELRDLVEGDGGKIVLVSHAPAAMLWSGPILDEEYSRGRRSFYEAMAAKLGAAFWDPVAVASIPLYGVSDVTHLNTHGAEIFTRVAFAVGMGEAARAAAVASRAELRVPPLDMFPTKDRTFNSVSALTRRPAGQMHPLLRFRTVDSLAVPKLPDDDLYVALRLPDNRDIVVPAVPVGPGDFVAEVNLPASQTPEGVIVRLLQGDGPDKVALSNPLQDYEWLQGWPRAPIVAGDKWSALALPPERMHGDTVYIAISQPPPTRAELGIRLAPAASTQGAVELGAPSAGAGALLQVSLPPSVPPGDYAVEVHDVATGTVLAKGSKLRVSAAPPPYVPPVIKVMGASLATERGVRVAWSGIRKPSRRDWIGLYRVGGKPEERLDFALTKATAEGEISFRIAPSLAPALAVGQFEFRLYTDWTMLARSEAVVFGKAQ